MSAMREPRLPGAASEYYFRRKLTLPELLPAIGVGIGAGLAAFYVAAVLLQRTPLRPELRPSSIRPKPLVPRDRVR